jgi:glycosyltransferase involved in cell wall biosynthesis
MAKTTNVLLLSNYPVVHPRHGGQIRLLNIKRAYEKAGWNVFSLAVYAQEEFKPASTGSNDIAFPADSPFRDRLGRDKMRYLKDALSGPYATSPDGGLPGILSKIPESIDVIHLEQPWLYPLAFELRRRPEYASAVLVYGSQNVEYAMKRDILTADGLHDIAPVIASIEKLERDAVLSADLALAVTQEDLDVFNSWGARNATLLPNGIEPWQAGDKALKDWRAKLPRRPWLLYVSSAHPPNFTGFATLLGYSLACLPPTSRLVIAGGVTGDIQRIASQGRWSELNLSRLQFLYTLPDEDLAAVKSLAHGFILPLLTGGGSNIKTAEALYSGSYVVGTSAAFRGYEAFLDLPEVRIADDAHGFGAKIMDVVTRPRLAPLKDRPESLALRQQLRWDACLKHLPSLVSDAIKRKQLQ